MHFNQLHCCFGTYTWYRHNLPSKSKNTNNSFYASFQIYMLILILSLLMCDCCPSFSQLRWFQSIIYHALGVKLVLRKYSSCFIRACQWLHEQSKSNALGCHLSSTLRELTHFIQKRANIKQQALGMGEHAVFCLPIYPGLT